MTQRLTRLRYTMKWLCNSTSRTEYEPHRFETEWRAAMKKEYDRCQKLWVFEAVDIGRFQFYRLNGCVPSKSMMKEKLQIKMVSHGFRQRNQS